MSVKKPITPLKKSFYSLDQTISKSVGCFVRGGRNGMRCFVRSDKNCMGCFVLGGMFCPGCQKMAWDVLSRDNLSYILLGRLAVKLKALVQDSKKGRIIV